MIRMKVLSNCLADKNDAELMMNLNHLEPEKAKDYLLRIIVDHNLEDLEDLRHQTLRFITICKYEGHPPFSEFGTGTIVILKDLLGESIEDTVIYISEMLSRLQIIYETDGPDEIITEVINSIVIIISYLYHLLEITL